MPAKYPHPIIAREGWPFLTASFAVSLALSILVNWWWSVPFWIGTVFILQFFRDPPRTAPTDPCAVVSPADGRIVAIERSHDPWLQRDALKISVFMNVFNVHSNRVPVGAKVENVWYHAGKFFNAAIDKASLENERNAVWLRTPKGTDIICVQVAGLIARRILCYVRPGDNLHCGERFGFIRFGSRVDVYLPLDVRVSVALGEKVYGGASVLAMLVADG